MVEIRLKAIANRLGKSITDIARETGLNRNTVTGLYHDKVDGIKFATIDLLCDTYGIKLSDLVVRKEMQIGAAPSSKIIRELKAESPFFSWTHLNALHRPSPHYFSEGVGNAYAFFVRDGAEWYFDRTSANRSARLIQETYGRDGAQEVYAAFVQARDQLSAYLNGLAAQPLGQFLSADLVKTSQRLFDQYADALALSAWIDLFDFGVRDELVRQVEQAHGLTSVESSLLIASGEKTPAVMRRMAMLKLAQASAGPEHKDFKKFLHEHPFVSAEELAKDIADYTKNPAMISQELDVLNRLPRTHADAVSEVLRTHKMRTNPLEFFAHLTTWGDERSEMDRAARFQIERLLKTIAERAHIKLPLARYLLPQEVEHALNGLVAERTLQNRYEQSMLIALEHGEYRVYEGERAISVQDDLASRYISHLAYGNV